MFQEFIQKHRHAFTAACADSSPFPSAEHRNLAESQSCGPMWTSFNGDVDEVAEQTTRDYKAFDRSPAQLAPRISYAAEGQPHCALNDKIFRPYLLKKLDAIPIAVSQS